MKVHHDHEDLSTLRRRIEVANKDRISQILNTRGTLDHILQLKCYELVMEGNDIEIILPPERLMRPRPVVCRPHKEESKKDQVEDFNGKKNLGAKVKVRASKLLGVQEDLDRIRRLCYE